MAARWRRVISGYGQSFDISGHRLGRRGRATQTGSGHPPGTAAGDERSLLVLRCW